MRKDAANDEKRIPEIAVDYSEELERIMDNPDLLVEEEYLDDWERNRRSDASRHYSISHHRHSSSHHHHSSSSGYSRHNQSSHHHSGNSGGRLASHHRSRHHHSRSENLNQENALLVPSDHVTSNVGEYSYQENFEEHLEPVSRNIDADNAMHPIKEDRTNIASAGTPVVEHTKRIASKASGSESSKRKAEMASESPKEKRRRQKRNRRYNKRKKHGFFDVIVRILLFFIVLGVAGVGTLIYLRALGEKNMKKKANEVKIEVPQENPDIDAVEDDGKIITYKGEKYRYNEEVSTILFLGTDRTVSQQENSESLIGANGQADTIILGIINNKNKKISFLSVNRDTMVPVDEYTVDDDYAGKKIMQICLAYSYGANNNQSCERMATAVSNYLYGIPINSYCRLSYDGIPALNDAVGGVTVRIPEDMTETNPSWTKGTKATLLGKDAITFVRWRNMGTVHTNELRMARQKMYLNAYIKQTLRQVRNDLTLPITLFSTATDYMTTDITASKVTYISSKAIEYGISADAIATIPGESKDGEVHVEFYSDDKALFEIILGLFYNKI